MGGGSNGLLRKTERRFNCKKDSPLKAQAVTLSVIWTLPQAFSPTVGQHFELVLLQRISMQSRAPQLEAVTAAFLVLAWITVGLRVWVRACMIKQFGPDDSVIIVSLVRIFLANLSNADCQA